MGHLARSRISDGLGIILEKGQSQQPVMVSRLFARPNPQPTVIRVEGFGHCDFLSIRPAYRIFFSSIGLPERASFTCAPQNGVGV